MRCPRLQKDLYTVLTKADARNPPAAVSVPEEGAVVFSLTHIYLQFHDSWNDGSNLH